VGNVITAASPQTIVTVADVSALEIRAELDERDVAAVGVGQHGFATADAFGDEHFALHVVRVTGEVGRKTLPLDDPRARVDSRVVEVLLRFDDTPAVSLPLGLRMFVHLPRH
jgi:hypothetical protein